ncbi:MAG TPA: ATP-binding protein [Cellvibrionaceae bacterium]|nr:ATP-binding protein [Cellvibrionaceae bacterium]HMW47257.1 ATP-binding protein [Cellvibrionaceae bacterium]HMW70310.1 ATP-binding protein [Cellvibrionaceae bacterium]HNG59137.1 ATP-binding protein [Cellvibrionaceae bacterium]
MALKLAHKLLLTHVLIIAVLATVFLTFSYLSNQSLVSDAMNGIDETVMEELAPMLSQHYQTEGGFNALLKDPDHWRGLVDGTFFKVFFSLSPAPSSKPISSASGDKNQPQTPSFAPASNLPACEPPFPTFLQRLALLDKDQQVLIAAPKAAAEYYQTPIKLQGEIIGWLRVGKINVDSLPYAHYFFKHQLRMALWAIACAAALALLLGYFLSRQITGPLMTIASETQKLASRDFSVNIQVHTGDELQALAQHINVIAGEIKYFNQRQKQWLMDISHELRTPITILYGEVTAILDNVTKADSNTIKSLQEEVVHLKRLVDDLHALSVLDDGEFHLSCEPIELGELIQQQASRYAERFETLGLELHIHCAGEVVWVNADRDRLGQVLRNLLENCLRYTHAPGVVSLNLHVHASAVHLILEDSGPGVPAEVLAKLFDRLYRVDAARTRAGGGAGLGLAICKTIILAHAGSIEAFLTEQGGLGVRIILPRTRVEAV